VRVVAMAARRPLWLRETEPVLPHPQGVGRDVEQSGGFGRLEIAHGRNASSAAPTRAVIDRCT
jgi:hypothetical protein